MRIWHISIIVLLGLPTWIMAEYPAHSPQNINAGSYPLDWQSGMNNPYSMPPDVGYQQYPSMSGQNQGPGVPGNYGYQTGFAPQWNGAPVQREYNDPGYRYDYSEPEDFRSEPAYGYGEYYQQRQTTPPPSDLYYPVDGAGPMFELDADIPLTDYPAGSALELLPVSPEGGLPVSDMATGAATMDSVEESLYPAPPGPFRIVGEPTTEAAEQPVQEPTTWPEFRTVDDAPAYSPVAPVYSPKAEIRQNMPLSDFSDMRQPNQNWRIDTATDPSEIFRTPDQSGH